MLFYLAGLNAFLLLLLLVGTLVLYSMIGLNIVHRIFQREEIKWKGARFITPFFSIIGALLALILAMVLVSTWQNYQKERENVSTEVSNIASLYRASKGLADPERIQIESMVKKIIKDIIEDTWPSMAEGRDGVRATKSGAEFLNYLMNFEPKNLKEKVIKASMIKKYNKATELRRSRALKTQNGIIPDAMWGVITLCVFISISSGFFFRLRPFSIHIILTILHSVMIGVVGFLIISLMYPYRGATHISSEPFQKLLNEDIPFIDKHSKQNTVEEMDSNEKSAE